MSRVFVPASLSVNGQPAQMLKLYNRQEETVPKSGFRVMGQIIIDGAIHYVTGFASPSNPANAAKNAAAKVGKKPKAQQV